MKKNLFILLLIAVFSLFSQTKIVKLANGEWVPFMGEKNYENGLISHIVKEAFKLEGYTVEYGFYPWKRAYELAKEGKEWTGTPGWKKNQEREELFYLSEPIITIEEVFFHRKDNEIEWKSYEDLKKYQIGLSIGYAYGEEFDRMRGQYNIEETPDDLSNLKKILFKRIDIFPCTKEVGYLLINKNFKRSDAKLITNHPKPVNTGDYLLLLTKKNPENKQIIFIFNKGLKKFKASRKYKKMLADSLKGKYN